MSLIGKILKSMAIFYDEKNNNNNLKFVWCYIRQNDKIYIKKKKKFQCKYYKTILQTIRIHTHTRNDFSLNICANSSSRTR